MMFLSTIFELIGLSLIIPIINIGLDSSISNSDFFSNLSIFFNISPDSQLLFYILLFVSVQIIKVSFLIWYLWYENNYIYSFKEFYHQNYLKIIYLGGIV